PRAARARVRPGDHHARRARSRRAARRTTDEERDLRGDAPRRHRRGGALPMTDDLKTRPALALGPFAERYGLIVIWLLVIVLFSLLIPRTFLNFATWQSILGSQAVLVILALGLIIPMTAGDFDLSVVGTLGLSSMTVAVVNVSWGWPIGIAI